MNKTKKPTNLHSGKTLLAVLAAGLLFASCAGSPKPLPPEKTPPERPEDRRGFSLTLASTGAKTEKDLGALLRKSNTSISPEKAEEFARLYIEEGRAEGINHDIAFCQMLLETGFLKFGGTVRQEQNNFCGLGVVDSKTPGEVFPTARLGVRAHIQHLKAYGSIEPLRQETVDRRFRFVKRGSAPTVYDLAGRWAADPAYGKKINDLLLKLYGN